MLTVQRAPLRTSTKMKRPAASKSAAAKKLAKATGDEEAENSEEKEKEADSSSEVESEEGGATTAAAEAFEPPAKKAKPKEQGTQTAHPSHAPIFEVSFKTSSHIIVLLASFGFV